MFLFRKKLEICRKYFKFEWNMPISTFSETKKFVNIIKFWKLLGQFLKEIKELTCCYCQKMQYFVI